MKNDQKMIKNRQINGECAILRDGNLENHM